MPYKHNWYIEGHIVSAEVWGDQTLDEMDQSNADLLEFIEEFDHPTVHVIINDDRLNSIPVSLINLRETLTYSTHPKLGWVVMTGVPKNSIVDFLVGMLAKLVRARYIRVQSFDEALNYLHKVDPTINWDAVSQDNSGKS